MEWYGPEDPWPEHSRDYFRAALSYARGAGWWFGKFSAHSFGKVVCDHGRAPGSRCEFLVFSTGSGAESKAMELRSMVDRCPHKSPRSDTRSSAVDAASGLLDQADVLISAAQRCMNADSMQARADELLQLAAEVTDKAGDSIARAEEELDGAVELESRSRDERDAAVGFANEAGYPMEAPVDADPLLTAAGDRVTTAERRLGPPSNSGRMRARVRERAAEIRSRITALQAQLSR